MAGEELPAPEVEITFVVCESGCGHDHGSLSDDVGNLMIPAVAKCPETGCSCVGREVTKSINPTTIYPDLVRQVAHGRSFGRTFDATHDEPEKKSR